LQPFWGISSVG